MKNLLPLCLVASIASSVMPAHAGINRFTSISPEGGIISSLVIDPSRPATVYAASYAGVFKSSDEGENWTLIFEPSAMVDGVFMERIVGPLAIDPLRPSTVYAGTNTGEIFKTMDGGATWTPKGDRQPFRILELVVDPSNSEMVYAVTDRDVLQSSDGGKSWRSRAPDTTRPEYLSSLAIDPSQASRLYLGSGGFLRVSNDRGEQWTTLRSGTYGNVAVDPTDSETIYASRDSLLISSRDGGLTWTDFPIVHGLQIVVDPLSSAVYALVIESWQQPYATRILKTTDRGLTWKRLEASVPDPSFLAIDPTASNVFYAAGRGDLFRSTTAGESWRRIHHGIPAAYIWDIAIDPTDLSTVFVTTHAGVLKSLDAGENWSEQKVDMPAARLSIDSRQPATIFASNDRAAARSTDRGETWTTVNPGARVRAIAVDPSNSANVYAALADGLSRSTDGGSGWSPIGFQQLPLAYYGFDGGAITVHPATPTTIFAAGGAGVVRSVDSGENWKTIFSDPSWYGSFYRKLLIDPAKPSTIYALAYRQVYRSDNDGEEWALVHSADDTNPGAYFTDLAMDPIQPSRLYLATSYGLFESFYRGQGWSEINEGLPTRMINSVVADSAGDVYAGTQRGLFVNTVSRAVVPGASTASISLRTHAGNYVSAANCGGSFVNANAKAIGPCETFEILDLNAGQLNDGDRIHLRADDDGFFVAEGGGRVGDSDALIRANRGVPDVWETFTIHRTTGSGPIRSGDSISLQSMNGTYVSADGGGANGCGCDSRLTADRAAPGAWETFLFVTR